MVPELPSMAERPLLLTHVLQEDLGPDSLLIEEFRGTAGLSELSRYDLSLLAPIQVTIPMDALVGSAVTVRVREGKTAPQFFHGILSEVTRGARDRRFADYKAVMVPRAWVMTRNRQCRIFKRQTVPEILDALFQWLRPGYRTQLGGSYPRREFTVQYQESDFDFACRLMEDEGIFYFFEQTEDGEVLVLADGYAGLTNLGAVGFQAALVRGLSDPYVFNWEKTQRLRAGGVVLRDQHFEMCQPANGRTLKLLHARRQTQDKVQVGRVDHNLRPRVRDQEEIYEYPAAHAHFFDDVTFTGRAQANRTDGVGGDLDRLARVRAEQEAVQTVLVRGDGNCVEFAPGKTFNLREGIDDDGSYVLEHVELAVRYRGFRSGKMEHAPYHNRFRALPSGLLYRPQRQTPRPRIDGTQTATVTSPSSDIHVHVDKYGRVKVQFHWDREGAFDGDNSCWVRVAQPWAGNGWGAFFWPRPGHEVVVTFEDGDPDRPLIVGSVYNDANMPPVKLPALANTAGIKSCVLGGDPASSFNCVIFHDQPGNAHLQLHSEKHDFSTTEATRYQRVGGMSFEYYGNPFMLPGSGDGGGDLAAAAFPHDSSPADERPVRPFLPPVPGGASGASADAGPEGAHAVTPQPPSPVTMTEPGSGAGGGLLDVVVSAGMIENAKHPGSELFRAMWNLGKSASVYGDNFATTLGGGRTTHIFGGCEIKRVVDFESKFWENMDDVLDNTVGRVLRKIKAIQKTLIPFGGLIVGGAGGATDFFVETTKHAAIYGGAKFDINYCPTYKFDTYAQSADKKDMTEKKVDKLIKFCLWFARFTIALAIVVDVMNVVFTNLKKKKVKDGKVEDVQRFQANEQIELPASALVSLIGGVLVSRLHGIMEYLEQNNAIAQMGLTGAAEGFVILSAAIKRIKTTYQNYKIKKNAAKLVKRRMKRRVRHLAAVNLPTTTK